MTNSFYWILIVISLSFYASNAIENVTFPLGSFCNNDTKISRNSITSRNIDILVSELVAKTASTGYIATSVGKGHHKIYGLAQCRADISNYDCSVCIQDAGQQIRKRLCPKTVDSRIWYDYCFLRYTTDNFIGQVDTAYGIYYTNIENVTDPDDFNKKLEVLLNEVKSKAVVLGKGEVKLSPSLTLYAMVQCTRDLAPSECTQCLNIPIGNFKDFCNNRKGCRVMYSSCTARYEVYPF